MSLYHQFRNASQLNLSKDYFEAGHKLKRVAIVGSGSAGIAALWALNRTPHDVYIYEAASRLGGHTNTVDFKHGKARTLVDTGFIVLNTATYPNFIAFLKALKVPTVPTEMTFGVSRDRGSFEWAGTSLSSLFTAWGAVFSPRMWRMLFDIVRFNQFALDLLKADERSQKNQETIGEYLEREGYSDAFRDDYLIPMTAAVWSTSPDKCSLQFPAVTLVRFMWNHHLLTTVGARPQWLTLKDCAKSYVEAVMRGFPPNHVFLSTPVKTVTNDEDGKVRVTLRNGSSKVYDHVIIATHGDDAMGLISSQATVEEAKILGGFKSSVNTAVLHSDLSLMPKCRRAWSSWNYITKSSPTSSNVDEVCLTYNMNILQHIPPATFGDVLVTLNPLYEPDPKTVQGRWTYTHPLYNSAAIKSQSLLHKIQNTRGISYCGAWTKYGFHEDAFSSGLKVAMDHLGATLPFDFTDSTFSRGKRPVLGISDLTVRLLVVLVQTFMVVFVERFVSLLHRPRTRDQSSIRKKKL